MGQYDVAIRYYERSREFAEKHGFPDIEFLSRNGIADCAVQLQEPSAGLEALAQLNTYTPQCVQDTVILGSAHNTLARLNLLAGNVVEAQYHAQESARMAQISGDEARNTRSTKAVLGLIDVYLGRTETGLSKLQDGLNFALQVCRNDVPDYLGMQIDAYQFAGYSDKALGCLWELVAWKRKLIDEKVASLQCEGLVSSVHLDARALNGDNRLLARAHLLQSRVHDCIQHFIEMGINADIACGYDLYRSFRLSQLAICFAGALGWEKWRIAPLALGTQLCNIGMIAVPARILLRTGSLSAGERVVINDHPRYGAELLRKSKLAALETAGVIAEQHHERYDGSGYPNFLAGESIAEEARMAAICDAFDAMTHSRPWRATPMSRQEAMGELEKGAGNQFDPRLVSAFIDLAQSEFGRHKDLDAFLAEGANSVEYVRARARLEALGAADTANFAVKNNSSESGRAAL